jgi:hypothetical protein
MGIHAQRAREERACDLSSQLKSFPRVELLILFHGPFFGSCQEAELVESLFGLPHWPNLRRIESGTHAMKILATLKTYISASQPSTPCH